MARLVGCEIHIGPYSRIDPDGHQHIQSAQRQGGLARHSPPDRIGKGGEGHQFRQPILYSQGGILHHIGHICIAQHLQVASHGQGIDRPLQCGAKVNEHLAINQTLTISLHLEELQVVGIQLQVGQEPCRIRKIDLSLQDQRLLAVGVQFILMEVQVQRFTVIVIYLLSL